MISLINRLLDRLFPIVPIQAVLKACKNIEGSYTLTMEIEGTENWRLDRVEGISNIEEWFKDHITKAKSLEPPFNTGFVDSNCNPLAVTLANHTI